MTFLKYPHEIFRVQRTKRGGKKYGSQMSKEVGEAIETLKISKGHCE